MLIRKPADIPPSEITPKELYVRRREFMKAASALTFATGLGIPGAQAQGKALKLPAARKSPLSRRGAHPHKDVTTYNNFYEFGTDKSIRRNAHRLKTRPWTVAVEGEVKRPKVYDVDELLKLAALEERIYRLRCVEGWSMVIPWAGFPLAELIRQVEPTGKARFVEFVTLYDRNQMPATLMPVLDWPYVEGLRLDEALHPLAILCFGLYGEVLPNQNGAPVRIVLPWKYGFKSAKSIVKIRFVERQPGTSWEKATPREYGFYSNVNPEVDHPRWSQARERRIGEFFKRPTLMFNGYGDQVADLYGGMDLRKHF